MSDFRKFLYLLFNKIVPRKKIKRLPKPQNIKPKRLWDTYIVTPRKKKK